RRLPDEAPISRAEMSNDWQFCQNCNVAIGHFAVSIPIPARTGKRRKNMNLRKWGLVALGFALSLFSVAPATAVNLPVERSGRVFHVAVCPRGNAKGVDRCFAHVVTDARGIPLNGRVIPAATPSGYGPADHRAAYGLTGVTGRGTPTVAIV